jgi:DNA-directed RNA polymerase specialized sigma subunit
MSAPHGALRRIAACRRRHGGPQPDLEAEALRDLVAAAQAGERGAREALIDAVGPLIGSVARTYRGCSPVSREELMQAGVVGVLRALDRFEPERETPFWAYASWWVRQAMQQLVSERGRPVVLPDRALRQLARIKDAEGEHLERCGREPSCAELAARAGLRREQVEQLIATERGPRALGQLLSGNDDGAATVGDRLADPVAEDAYERIPAQVDSDRLAGSCLRSTPANTRSARPASASTAPSARCVCWSGVGRQRGPLARILAARWPVFWPRALHSEWTASGRRRQPSSADRGHPGASRPPAACAVGSE